MPCSGKSYWLKYFAEVLKVPGIDLDTYIEKSYKKSIDVIFQQKGENYFRQLENTALTALLSNHKAAVIATGGGTPCFNNNLVIMKKAGIVLYLTCSIDLLCDRIEQSSPLRPLLKANSRKEIYTRVNKTFLERKPFYEQANLIFDPIQDKFEEVIQKLKAIENL